MNTKITKKEKLLAYYEYLINENGGQLAHRNGLCTEIRMILNRSDSDLFAQLFSPYLDTGGYWGTDVLLETDDAFFRGVDFGPTRQNLLLLFAEMIDEL